jgi:hypothetical protein
MADNFLKSGASRSELLAALMDKQNRRYSQEQNPYSIGEAFTRTGSRLVDAYMQKKLMDEELERRKGQQSTDMAALKAYALGQQGIEGQAAVPASGAALWQNPDFDPNAVGGAQQVTSIDPARQGKILGMGIDPTQQMVGGDYIPAQEEIMAQAQIDPQSQKALRLAFEQNPNMSPEAANNLVSMYSEQQKVINNPAYGARPWGSPKTITVDGVDYEMQQMYDPKRIGDPNTINGSGMYTINMGLAADLGTRGASGVKIDEAKSTADIDVEKARLINEDASTNDQIDQAFAAIGNINSKIRTFDRIITAIDKGASTGVLEGYLKSVTDASIELDQLRNEMGLQVIGSTTFGSLSAPELAFALDTALPTDMRPESLKQWVIDRKNGQSALRSLLTKQVAFLDAGNSKADLLAIFEKENNNPNESIDDIIARNTGK